MWKWIKKILTKREPEQERAKITLLPEEQDKEIKELLLLQDPICGKHHG